MRKFAILLGILTIFLASACGSTDQGPIALDKQTLEVDTKANVSEIIINLGHALEFLEDSEMLATGMDLFDNDGGEIACMVNPEDPEGEPLCEDEGEPEPLEINSGKASTAAIELLEQYVFVDAQLEVDDGKYLIYKLDPDIFCASVEAETSEDGDDQSQDCVDFLTRVPVRLKFWSLEQGTQEMDLILGENQDMNMLHLSLTPDSASIEFDLAAFKKLWDFMTSQTNVVDMDLQVCKGKIRFELLKVESNWTVIAEVTDAVLITGKIDNDNLDLALGLGSIEATILTQAKVIDVTSDLSAIIFIMPYRDLIEAMWEDVEGTWTDDGEYQAVEPPTVSGEVSFSLDKLQGHTSFSTEGNESLSISGLNFGAGFEMTVNSVKVLKVGLENDDASQVFTLGWAPDAAYLSSSKGFSLVAELLFQDYMSHFPEIPGFFADDRITLQGAGQEGIRVDLTETDEGDGSTRLTRGTVTISAKSAPTETVTISEGLCFFLDDSSENEGHELLRLIHTAACN